MTKINDTYNLFLLKVLDELIRPLNIEYFDIHELKPYENNARINDNAVEFVANSIKEFGFKNPIILDENKVIIAGHTRLKAAEKLGLEKVPCVIATDLTEEQVKAFRIADNSSGQIAEWDYAKLVKEVEELNYDLSSFGLQAQLDEIERIAEEQRQAEEDEYVIPEEIDNRVKPGEIWQLGEHKLMCGDSTKAEDFDKIMDGKVADLLFTDPPYNVDIENSQGMKIENDNMPPEEFDKFIDICFKNCSNNLKKGGAFYIWHADGGTLIFRNNCIKYGLLVKQCLIWVKNGFTFGRQDYKWQHEPCLYGWKEGTSHYFVEEFNHPTVIESDTDFSKMKKEKLVEILNDIFSEKIAKTVIRENKPVKNDLHPTMKPVAMCGRLIKNSSKKSDIVLDAFGGSGSTLIACEQLGRICYMIEHEPFYASVIVDRWEKFTGKKAVRIA